MINRIVQWLTGAPAPALAPKPALKRYCFVCGDDVGPVGIAVCKSCLYKARHESD